VEYELRGRAAQVILDNAQPLVADIEEEGTDAQAYVHVCFGAR